MEFARHIMQILLLIAVTTLLVTVTYVGVVQPVVKYWPSWRQLARTDPRLLLRNPCPPWGREERHRMCLSGCLTEADWYCLKHQGKMAGAGAVVLPLPLPHLGEVTSLREAAFQCFATSRHRVCRNACRCDKSGGRCLTAAELQIHPLPSHLQADLQWPIPKRASSDSDLQALAYHQYLQQIQGRLTLMG